MRCELDLQQKQKLDASSNLFCSRMESLIIENFSKSSGADFSRFKKEVLLINKSVENSRLLAANER